RRQADVPLLIATRTARARRASSREPSRKLPRMPRFRVDLRSDTVSTPSPTMRAAMAEAEVGDAWYGDDPTVNRLQDRAAELTGMEAGLYVATGTMANQIGVRLHASGAGHLIACEE